MNLPPVVSPPEWKAAREELLVKEKELTRARDALAAERRRMPRMAVEKEYRFEGPDGPVGLEDLFAGRRQLIVYRFFFDPDVNGYPEKGCPGCSFVADQVAHLAHLNARDTRNQRLPPQRRRGLPHLLRRQARRRADGRHLELPRHHRARAAGDLGGLAAGLSPDAGLRLVEPPRRIRRGHGLRACPLRGDRLPARVAEHVIPLGHVGGLPVEELLPALASTGASFLTARAWLSLQLRRDHRRESRR